MRACMAAQTYRNLVLTIFLVALVFMFSAWAGEAAAIDVTKLPPPATNQVDFERDIKPIFETACYRCHGAERPKSKFSLVSRESALKGGSQGVDIIPGNSGQSPLIHYVAQLVPDMEMPPASVELKLSTEQIGLLRSWIDQGANWSALDLEKRSKPQFSMTPTLRGMAVSGNTSKFRELYWSKPGLSGGVEYFQFKQFLEKDRWITLEGRSLPLQNDFKVGMTLEQKDFGFTRMGFENYRKYFSDAGGYYPTFSPDPFTLNRNLYLDIGKAWFDIGLTLPNKPRVVLGYEYDFKRGTKSTLQWGPVTDASGDIRNIYPASKDIDEKTHILKLDLNHTIKGVELEDSFRAEFYNLDTQRANVDVYQLGKSGPDKLVLVKEGDRHWQAANTFRLEKQVNDWLFASAGYLFSHLDGSTLFNLNTVLTPAALIAPVTVYGFDNFWSSRQILLDQQSHVFNANFKLEPLKGLTISAGVQSEWTTQRGFGDVQLDQGDPTTPGGLFAQPAVLRSDLDKFAVDENIAVRYYQIPCTVLYAEARLQQASLGQYEEQNGGLHDFLQDTDVKDDLKEYRTGFSFSPWSWTALNGYYKHRDKQTDYQHLTDLTRFGGGAVDNEGYPAFILWRQTVTDEVAAKLALRLATWLKTTLAYTITSTDYQTATESAIAGFIPGGQMDAGIYDARTYSISTAITPWRRFYLTSTLSYMDTRTRTAQNGLTEVIPYRGDIYTVLAGATYILSQTTDLQLNYSFSRADYGPDEILTSVPLGANYDWHGVQASIMRRFNKSLLVRLQYGFSHYNEPASGQFNNFSAHAVFVTLTKAIP